MTDEANADMEFEAGPNVELPDETILGMLGELTVPDTSERELTLPCKYRLADTMLAAAS